MHLIRITNAGGQTNYEVLDETRELIHEIVAPVASANDLFKLREGDLQGVFKQVAGKDADYKDFPDLVNQVWAALESRGNLAGAVQENKPAAKPAEQPKGAASKPANNTGGAKGGSAAPEKEGPVGQLRKYLDANPSADRKQVMEWADSQGLNRNTIGTQYNKLRKQ